MKVLGAFDNPNGMPAIHTTLYNPFLILKVVFHFVSQPNSYLVITTNKINFGENKGTIKLIQQTI